mgnify:FL=1
MKRTYLKILFVSIGVFFSCSRKTEIFPFQDQKLSFEERAKDLVSRLTLEEKIAQMSAETPAIDRFNISEYRYQGEALHGLAEAAGGRLLKATSFPQSIALGSTWDPGLMNKVATAISDEARAYNNKNELDLTFWSPNINMLRDPRWGRNDEAYSEDPYLMSRMAVAFVQGMQGDDPKYIKTVVTPKHFVANNSEFNRHDGTSDIKERWLREYYFPAFKASFIEGGAFSTMCAYNRVNGVPACGDEWLLNQVLRGEWGFEGYVVSDCGAIRDIYENHKFKETGEQAAAFAVNNGCDLNCGSVYEEALLNAVNEGLVSEEQLDLSLERLFISRFKLGLFDDKEKVPYSKVPYEVIEGEKHQAIALEAAQKSIILLKNDGNALPLSKDIKSLAVIGPNADKCVLGAYSGKPSRQISVYQGIKEKVGDQIEVFYEKGCATTYPDEEFLQEFEEAEQYLMDTEKEEYNMLKAEMAEEYKEDDDTRIARAVALAKKVDQVVLVMGTNRFVSTEESDAESLDWPGRQQDLIRKVYEANPNVVMVLVHGFPITMNWEVENIPAIVESWYAGQEQGVAIADVLFGDVNPGGKLTITYFSNEEDLPPIGDYDITKGRTYWFFEGEVIYPFGYGLSYTNFDYRNFMIDEDRLSVSVDIVNTGAKTGDEVVQLYVKDIESSVIQPRKELREFTRISLNPGEKKTVSFQLDEQDFMYWNQISESWEVEPGDFEIQMGSSSVDIKFSQVINYIP